jgi:hypothetical protein
MAINIAASVVISAEHPPPHALFEIYDTLTRTVLEVVHQIDTCFHPLHLLFDF